LARSQHFGVQEGLHQQQPPSSGEQVTESPPTLWPARLMIAK
jgi:hypothetical protein